MTAEPLTIIGADPGLTGGIVVLEGLSDPKVVAAHQPVFRDKRMDIKAAMDALWPYCNTVDLFVVEKVGAMGKDSPSAMFTFGSTFGHLLGMAAALAWPTRLVRPQEWKKVVLAGTTRTKEVTCGYVHDRFPSLNLRPAGKRKDQDGLADAACMAEWGWLYLRGRTT
jgi:hypothetical protein